MEEEEARLKALLDQTSDYDERKKIRAELRSVRMKKLDSLNNAVATESNERATRRAERARARKAEQMNGDASTAEKDASSSEIVITDQILAEIHDEETLQKLLSEIPTSQFEDRRRIRTRIREVKRSKAEGVGDPPSHSTYSRQTKEVTVTTEETSNITVKTNVEPDSIETNHRTDNGGIDFKVTIEPTKDVVVERLDGYVSEEAPGEDQDEAAVEQAFETEQQQREIEPEQEHYEEEDAKEDAQRYAQEEDRGEQEVIENGKGPQADDDPPTEIQFTLSVDETEEVHAEPAEEINEEGTVDIDERATEESFQQERKVSVEIQVNNDTITDVQVKEEEDEEPERVEEPSETSNVIDDSSPEQRQEDDEEESTDGKAPPNNKKPSGWSTQEEEKAKKPGRINTMDFRVNLKKSGRISTGAVNLEKRNISSGAQVDFRGGLKQSGKSPGNVKLAGKTERFSRSAQDSKRKVDFGVSLKKRDNAEESADVQKDLPDKTSEVNKTSKGPPPKPTPKPTKGVTPVESSPAPAQTEVVSETPAQIEVVSETSVASSKVPEKQIDASKGNDESKPSEKLPTAQIKESRAPPKKSKVIPEIANRSQKKVQATEPPRDNDVNDITVKVGNVSLAPKEPAPVIKIEVTEHEEEEGDTHTEVREVNTSKGDGDEVEETKEVTKVAKTDVPGGGQVTIETKKTTTTTTRKGFMDPELQKRMAARQRDRVSAKKEQASSAKNKRMVFMQKLEANSPATTGPALVKRSNSNVDKLLAWCRFKTRDYEGIQLSNFSSSWADGLAFCAILHLYLPDKIPYDELRAGGDKKRNFEVAFSAATEAGVAELLDVEDMLAVSKPEPKSVMTYVSSIYKHFNPS